MLPERDRRSHVPPTAPERTGQKPRQRWMRPDGPRPAAPVRILLPTLDTALPDVETPEPLTALDRLSLLPQAAQADIVRGAL